MARKKRSEFELSTEGVVVGVDPAHSGSESTVRQVSDASARVSWTEVSSLEGPFTVTRVSMPTTRLLVVREDSPLWADGVAENGPAIAKIFGGAIAWVDCPVLAPGDEGAKTRAEAVVAAVRAAALAVRVAPPRRAATPVNRAKARTSGATSHRAVVEELAAASQAPRRDALVDGLRRTMDSEKI